MELAMMSLGRPSDEAVARFLEQQRQRDFSYAPVGLTRDGQAPPGAHIHHRQARLGHGPEVWAAARDALTRWAMFDVGWASLCWPRVTPEPEAVVAVVSGALGVFTLNACRITEVFDEDDGDTRRFGFCYGTLPGHVMQGEERFMVTWRRGGDEVAYDLFAWSRPNGPLSALLLPFIRSRQWRFGTDSMAAMQRAASRISA